MARKYHSDGVPAITAQAITKAQAALERAGVRLAEVEAWDPLLEGWADQYNAASAAAGAARRRLEMLEQLRARQIEKSGKREAAVAALAGDLASIEASVKAARDRLSTAAAAAGKALAGLASAEAEFNNLLAEGRARLAQAGILVHDDLLDEGQFYGEGANGRSVRLSGVDWLPQPPGALAAFAAAAVYPYRNHPLALASKSWRPHDAGANGVAVPEAKPLPAEPVLAPRYGAVQWWADMKVAGKAAGG